LYVMFFVYVIYSESSDKFYIGSCNILAKRILQHNTGRNISTKHGIPWEVKYFKVFSTREEALKREMEIKKKKSRKYIEWLISSAG